MKKENSVKNKKHTGQNTDPKSQQTPKEFQKAEPSTLKTLLACIRPYGGLLALSLGLTVVSVLANLLVPVLAGQAIDFIIGPGSVSFPAVLNRILQIGIIVVSGSLCQWISGCINNVITFRITRDLRSRMFVKLQELPLSALDRRPDGEMLSRCITDIEQISDGLLMGFTQVFNGVLTIVCTIVFMVRINPWITLAVVLLSPLSFALTRFIASRTHEMFARQSESRGTLTAFTDESIENMKLVYAFHHKEESRLSFDEKNRVLAGYSMRATFFSSLVNPSTRLIYSTLYAIVTIFGSFSVIGGSMTIGSLSAFLGYTNQYAKPFNEITGVIAEFQNALASAARVFEVLSQPSKEPMEQPSDAPAEQPSKEPQTFPSSAPSMPASGTVSLSHVYFSYDPAIPLIRDFSLAVLPGMRVAIVGPTGCGKTTLINLLMRFYDASAGEIQIDGTDIRDMPFAALRHHFGMVLQDIWLRSGTIRDNIAYGRPDASDGEIVAAAKNAYAHDFIKKLPDGYDTRIGEDGGSLSQGQKQLLCIARVMLADPSMLILDEATSSVDSMTEIRITRAFDRLMKGRTAFIVAHRLSTVVNADLILVMKNGVVVERGRHEDLLNRRGFYYEIYQSQFAQPTKNESQGQVP